MFWPVDTVAKIWLQCSNFTTYGLLNILWCCMYEHSVILQGYQLQALKNFIVWEFHCTMLGLALCYPMFSKGNCIAMLHMNGSVETRGNKLTC